MHILSSFSAPYNDVKNVFNNITFTFSVRVYTCTQLYCHTKSAITPMGSIACVHAFIVTMLEYLHHREHHCCIILPTYATLGLIQHTYNRCRVTYHLLSHYHLHQSCICILWPYFIQVLKSSAIAAVFCTGS